MLITLIFSVVAVKSRTTSSFSYSAIEQVFVSWEGAQLDSWPELANGNIPCHRHHAEFTYGAWLGGRNLSALLVSVSLNGCLMLSCWPLC